MTFGIKRRVLCWIKIFWTLIRNSYFNRYNLYRFWASLIMYSFFLVWQIHEVLFFIARKRLPFFLGADFAVLDSPRRHSHSSAILPNDERQSQLCTTCKIKILFDRPVVFRAPVDDRSAAQGTHLGLLFFRWIRSPWPPALVRYRARSRAPTAKPSLQTAQWPALPWAIAARGLRGRGHDRLK